MIPWLERLGAETVQRHNRWLKGRDAGERMLLADQVFDGVDFTGGGLAGAQMVDCDFRGARLQDANLKGAQLTGCRFDCVDMTRVDFQDARLDACSLTDAVMRGANLEGADVRGGSWSRARLDYAGFARAVLRGAVLAGASFTHARMAGSQFDGCSLEACVFTGADIAGAAFASCDMRGAIDLASVAPTPQTAAPDLDSDGLTLTYETGGEFHPACRYGAVTVVVTQLRVGVERQQMGERSAWQARPAPALLATLREALRVAGFPIEPTLGNPPAGANIHQLRAEASGATARVMIPDTSEAHAALPAWRDLFALLETVARQTSAGALALGHADAPSYVDGAAPIA